MECFKGSLELFITVMDKIMLDQGLFPQFEWDKTGNAATLDKDNSIFLTKYGHKTQMAIIEGNIFGKIFADHKPERIL